ncbi:hypothetical protein AB0I28_12700 [Phytomonospora sp. NPDC050363]|uniref:hypothetical protein n=1 Tax=Phytomonospora sp. NPDC050363 TaxID=3155642 RepID=UPI003407AD75
MSDLHQQAHEFARTQVQRKFSQAAEELIELAARIQRQGDQLGTEQGNLAGRRNAHTAYSSMAARVVQDINMTTAQLMLSQLITQAAEADVMRALAGE